MMKFLASLKEALLKKSSTTESNDLETIPNNTSSPNNQPIMTLSALNAILIELCTIEALFAPNEMGRRQLLDKIIDIIHSHIEIYFLGFFTLDMKEAVAAFEAGSGKVGKVLQSRGHQLPTENNRINKLINENELWTRGDVSLIYSLAPSPSWNLNIKLKLACIENFGAPLLPNTSWELFLPMRDKQKVIGIFWIHTDDISGFSIEDITHFQFLADQISVRLQRLSIKDDSHLIS